MTNFEYLYGDGSYGDYLIDNGYLRDNSNWEHKKTEKYGENDWDGFNSNANWLSGANVIATKTDFQKEIDVYNAQMKAANGGGNDVANLFGKNNAGYIADENSFQIFPNQSFDKDMLITRYMVEGVGVWILGMVNSGAGTVTGGLAITVQGQEHLVKMKPENYLQNGQGMGMYAINVNAPGAFPRAMLFNAVDGSSIGWHHTTVKGAPTMQYHIYLKFFES